MKALISWLDCNHKEKHAASDLSGYLVCGMLGNYNIILDTEWIFLQRRIVSCVKRSQMKTSPFSHCLRPQRFST